MRRWLGLGCSFDHDHDHGSAEGVDGVGGIVFARHGVKQSMMLFTQQP